MDVSSLRDANIEYREQPNERRKTLPEYLRQLRVSHHYRQNYIAGKLNISRQTYSHYETGRIRPPAGALYGLARLYGIPVENLLSLMMLGQYGIESRAVEHEGSRGPEVKIDKNIIDKNVKDKLNENELYEKISDKMESQLLSGFRSLSQGEREDILSIIRLKIESREEKENRDAERKATV